ncbi:hypothetical protein JCM1841_002334 [Sporobolomyces salmonicolor]
MMASTNHSNRSFGQYSKASTSQQVRSSFRHAASAPYEQDPGTQRFVVGKIDAGIAVLISDSVHLIEFPSLLLPQGVGPGSIVNIACTRNYAAERAAQRDFWDLQRDIYDMFGKDEPQAPNLRIRNTTQTSVTLEWDKLDLASASLISLSIFRNNQRLTTIPNPLHNTSTKLSGLQLDTDYTFHLVLKTSAGTYTSPVVKTRTHTIENTTGISVCFGLVEPPELLDEAKKAVGEMGARWDDKIQIETTHFVATSSAGRADPRAGPGVEYQKAMQLSIPVVSPEWLLACHRSSKLVPISAYYLGQTNHAASLSSAQLVSSPPARKVTAAAAAVPQQIPEAPVQREQQVETPPPVRLEEDVEAPPADQVNGSTAETTPELEPEPETDASTRAVKSDVEEEPTGQEEGVAEQKEPEAIEERPQEGIAEDPPVEGAVQVKEERPEVAESVEAPLMDSNASESGPAEAQPDAPAEELAHEQEQDQEQKQKQEHPAVEEPQPEEEEFNDNEGEGGAEVEESVPESPITPKATPLADDGGSDVDSDADTREEKAEEKETGEAAEEEEEEEEEEGGEEGADEADTTGNLSLVDVTL